MPATRRTLTLPSPAKLNLFLEVLGKRSDGFHELETVMLRTQFADMMTFTSLPGSEIRLQLSPSASVELQRQFPLDGTNLILRAATALQQRTGCTQGADIIVEKVIPPESGLAGGSSNAATTLNALNELWDLQLPPTELHAIAAELGSDINFLLSGHRAAICHGRGEIVNPIPVVHRFWFVAVRPESGNRTADVFRKLGPVIDRRHPDEIIRVLAGESASPLSEVCCNRLTQAARIVNPQMALLLDQLEAHCLRPAFMSGSGSTCFVISHDAAEASDLKDRIGVLARRPVWILG